MFHPRGEALEPAEWDPPPRLDRERSVVDRPHRLGVVSYLNAKPLIEGLDRDPRFALVLDVPARLPAMLDDGRVDVALVPTVDLVQPGRDWRVISDACIGCDGETLTVRVFSRGPAGGIRRLFVDGDSHTSVALARILWREHFGKPLDTIPLNERSDERDDDGVLLIGDKVIRHGLIGYDVETDLGSLWKSMTTLPFVFAAWAVRSDADFDKAAVAGRLEAARDAGVAAADMIAADLGPGLGWPVNLARRYLTQRLKFTLGPRQRVGMNKFLSFARDHALVPQESELVFA